MYEILKNVPHSPKETNFKEMDGKKLVDISLLKNLLNDAKENNYITFSFRNNPYNDIFRTNFSLTELGQVAIEEYEGTKYSSKQSKWALIIAGLSLVVSVIALFCS